MQPCATRRGRPEPESRHQADRDRPTTRLSFNRVEGMIGRSYKVHPDAALRNSFTPERLENTRPAAPSLNGTPSLGGTHLDLHEAVLRADALDADLGARVRVDHAAQRVRRIVVQCPIVEHRHRGEARNG